MAQRAHGSSSSIHLVEQALADIRKGRMVILTDDEDRENEGDLVMAAEKATPEAINFMATHGRGLICLSLTEDRLRQDPKQGLSEDVLRAAGFGSKAGS